MCFFFGALWWKKKLIFLGENSKKICVLNEKNWQTFKTTILKKEKTMEMTLVITW
jgi:hypothetical protein